MANVIDAIINLIKNPVIQLNSKSDYVRNRANNMGEALEEYIKDLFAETIEEKDLMKRIAKHSSKFIISKT